MCFYSERNISTSSDGFPSGLPQGVLENEIHVQFANARLFDDFPKGRPCGESQEDFPDFLRIRRYSDEIHDARWRLFESNTLHNRRGRAPSALTLVSHMDSEEPGWDTLCNGGILSNLCRVGLLGGSLPSAFRSL